MKEGEEMTSSKMAEIAQQCNRTGKWQTAVNQDR